MRRVRLLPLTLLIAGVLAGRFVWPRQRGIPAEEKARVNAAWAAAAQKTGVSEASLTQRPSQPELAKMWDFLQRLETTPASEFPALWAELNAVNKMSLEGQYRRTLFTSEQNLLAARWAELDPEAARVFFSSEPATAPLLEVVFRIWASRDPDAAAAAVMADAKDGGREEPLRGVFSAASEHPADLIAWGHRLASRIAEWDEAEFEGVVPREALHRAFLHDPAGVRELAAKLPAWFQVRIEAIETAREMITDPPAALARMDSLGLTKKNATEFLLDMFPGMEAHPGKLPAVFEHLTENCGPAWLDMADSGTLLPLLTALAKAAPDQVHSLLHNAGKNDSYGLVSGRAFAAANLFASDPHLALQLAPPGDDWVSGFIGGPMLPPGAAGPPDQALELLRTAPSSTMRDGLLHEALTALMKSSPEAAAAWIDALPPGELKDTARVTLDHPDFSPAQLALERAAASAAHGGENAASMEAVRKSATRLLYGDAAQVTGQIMSWTASPARDAALEAVALRWSAASTPDALAWAELLPASVQPQALNGILQTWAAAEPAEASKYLAALPAGPERDAPAAGLARGLAGVDPASALHWGATVQDAEQRAATLREVASRWITEDPDAARAGLLSIPGLTEAERATLLRTAPTPP